jgi:hypothetical protein
MPFRGTEPFMDVTLSGILLREVRGSAPPGAILEKSCKAADSSLIARLTKARRDSGRQIERDGASIRGGTSRDRNTTFAGPNHFHPAQLLSSVAIELVIANAAAAHPSPPRSSFLGEARKHERGGPQIELSARSCGCNFLLRRRQQTDFNR